MRCSELDPLVVPFVDGEIRGGERATVEGHLDACPPCRARVDAERAAREALCAHRAALRSHAPAELRSRCAGLCAARHHARWVPLALAAAASLVAGLFWFGRTDAGTPVMAAQLTLDHVKCTRFGSDRVAGSPRELAAYWRDRYGWPISVPEADVPGVRLAGVRRCASSEGQTAHLLYMHEGRPVSLFISRTTAGGGRTPRTLGVFGHDAVVWSRGDRTYVLVGDEPRADIESLATLIKKEVSEP